MASSFAADESIQVVDPVPLPTMSVDKSGSASISLTLANPSTATALPLQLSLSDFRHVEDDKLAYPVNTVAAFTGSDGAKLPAQLSAGQRIGIKISVSQLWEAGESAAELRNAGNKLADVRALRLPVTYNVQIEGQNPEVVFAPDSHPKIKLINGDPMTYRFSWRLVARGGERKDSGLPVVVLPANGPVELDLSQVSPPVPWFSAGTLKDDVTDANLMLDPVIKAQEGIPPQASKILPLKLRLQFWRRPWQQASAIFWTMMLLLVGALASLWFRLLIPNAAGALKLTRRLDDMDEKLRGIGDDLASQWRVLLAWRIAMCRNGLREVPWSFPSFATKLAELQTSAAMYSDWLEITYSVAIVMSDARKLTQTGIPPTMLALIEEKYNEALRPIETGFTNADELQSMRTALKAAQEYVQCLAHRAAIPDLDSIIKGREARIQPDLDALKQAFPTFVGLLNQAEGAINRPPDPAAYLDRDTFSMQAELLKQYRDLTLRAGAKDFPPQQAPVAPGGGGVGGEGPKAAVAQAPVAAPGGGAGGEGPKTVVEQAPVAPGGGGVGGEGPKTAVAQAPAPAGGEAGAEAPKTALARLMALRQKFESYVQPEAYESLRFARLFVTEMRQDFYPSALLAEVAKSTPALEIRAEPLPITTGVPVHFSLRFLRQALNEIAAVQEWTYYWDFNDATEREVGWDVYHAYSTPGDRTVTVTIVDLDGNIVTTGTPIQKVVTVAGSLPVQQRWLRIPRWRPENKIEASRLGFVLAIALFGVFATARGKVESLGVFEAAAALIALGFGVDTLKNLITQESGGK